MGAKKQGRKGVSLVIDRSLEEVASKAIKSRNAKNRDRRAIRSQAWAEIAEEREERRVFSLLDESRAESMVGAK